MSEKIVERISDTEAIVEGLRATANYYAHVFRPLLRTEDNWKHCCQAATIDQIRVCPHFGKERRE